MQPYMLILYDTSIQVFNLGDAKLMQEIQVIASS